MRGPKLCQYFGRCSAVSLARSIWNIGSPIAEMMDISTFYFKDDSSS